MHTIQYQQVVGVEQFKRILLERIANIYNLAESLTNNAYSLAEIVVNLENCTDKEEAVAKLESLYFSNYSLFEEKYNDSITMVKTYLESLQADIDKGESNDSV